VTDIFEEVNEELRRDTFADWWKKYRVLIIAAIVIAIGGVGIWEFMKAQRASDIDRQAKVFDTGMAALENSDLAGAKTAFTQLSQEKGGFGALANLMLASVEHDQSKDPKLMAPHLRAAAERDEGLIGDIATLKLAYTIADTADLPQLEATVKPLIDKGGYVGSLAREVVAAKALATGDIERARTEYTALSFELDAPQNVKLRATQTLGTLPKAATPAAASAPAPATPAAPAQTPTDTPAPAQPAPAQQ
jgi:hypothetical protein